MAQPTVCCEESRITCVSLPPNADPFIGQVLDSRYRIEQLIARGGMATVYRAMDLRLDRIVALKILAGTLVTEPGFVDRFINEAKSTASLTHPNVVAVHDQGIWHEFPFLVMEYVDGQTIREVLRAHGPFTSAHALEIMKSVLAGLTAAHDKGFVHRDIKPENVLITADGHIKVTDFGLARVINSQLDTTNTGAVLLGTMAYLSPEQVLQQSVDQRSDVYSAGIMLFEMLTGRVPFSGQAPLEVAYRHVNEDVPAPSTFQPDVPPALDHLVLAATRRNPAERIQSARSFHEAVLRAEAGVPQAESLTAVIPLPDTKVIPLDQEVPTQKWNTPMTQMLEENDRPSQHNRKKFIIIAGATAIVLGLGYWYTSIFNMVTVPTITKSAEVKSLLVPLNLKANTERQFSENVAKGHIIATSPDAGAKVKRGSTIRLLISKGKERYTIPDGIIGLSKTDATSLLSGLNLTVAGSKERYSQTIPSGKVVSTYPLVGTKVKRATPVTLVLSKGPAPVTLPKLVGLSISRATKLLTAKNLTIKVEAQVFDNKPEGTILSSNPAQGQVVAQRSRILVTVSKGPVLIPIPNVVKMSRTQAVATLRAAGFSVKVQNSAGPVVFNKVYSQSPGAYSSARRGSVVIIEIV